jgi:hypothetical protein
MSDILSKIELELVYAVAVLEMAEDELSDVFALDFVKLNSISSRIEKARGIVDELTKMVEIAKRVNIFEYESMTRFSESLSVAHQKCKRVAKALRQRDVFKFTSALEWIMGKIRDFAEIFASSRFLPPPLTSFFKKLLPPAE